MPRQTQLYGWAERVATRFPELPRHQADALAGWSLGMVLAHACGLSAVALALDRPRVHRLFRVGLAMILAGLLAGQVPAGRFQPEPWPVPRPIPTLTEEEFRSRMNYP